MTAENKKKATTREHQKIIICRKCRKFISWASQSIANKQKNCILLIIFMETYQTRLDQTRLEQTSLDNKEQELELELQQGRGKQLADGHGDSAIVPLPLPLPLPLSLPEHLLQSIP